MDFPFTRIKGGVGAPQGFLTSAVSCGIKNPEASRLDLALIYSEKPCASAGAFTTNRVKAAPVRVSQSHLRKGELRAIIANSGNANACTGVQGIEDANAMCDAVAVPLGLKRSQIGVCSTGVIGLPMPITRITPRAEELVSKLGPKNGPDVAAAIMTSDTRPKEVAISFDLGEHRVRIGGCVKGAGMISPSMATMLCFITTDANLPSACLRKSVLECVEESFNRITIDGDMSTNDTVLLLASGVSGVSVGASAPVGLRTLFQEALDKVCFALAEKIVGDGEKITKVVSVEIEGARTRADAEKIARAIGNSLLVKSSWFGEDPNWGRLADAAGYARTGLDEAKLDIYYDDIPAVLGGKPLPENKPQWKLVVKAARFAVRLKLNLGDAKFRLLAADLTDGYVNYNKSE